jgi:hypothetical protein
MQILHECKYLFFPGVSMEPTSHYTCSMSLVIITLLPIVIVVGIIVTVVIIVIIIVIFDCYHRYCYDCSLPLRL